MKFIQGASAFLVVAALLFATGAGAETYKRVTKAGDFRKEAVGKTLKSWAATIKLSKNGTLAGKVQKGPMAGAKVSGTWKWKNGLYCSDVAINKKPYSKKCQIVLYAKGPRKMLFLEKDASRGNAYDVK